MSRESSNSLTAGMELGSRYCLAAADHAPSGTSGARLGRGVGESLEFMDHRDYQVGDDLRRVDWGVYARSDQLVVKVYREEVAPHVDLLLDSSCSMALADTPKQHAAIGLAAALATAATNAQHTTRVWQLGDTARMVEQSQRPPTMWKMHKFDGTRDAAETFLQATPRLYPRAMRIWIGDLLSLVDPEAFLAQLSHQASATVVVQLLARVDLEPPPLGAARLVDSETGELRELFIDKYAQQRYRNRLEDHRQAWSAATAGHGALLIPLVAETMFEPDGLHALVREGILQVD